MKISVKVKTTAREEKVEKIDADTFKVSVKEPPKEGRANRAVVRALADYFGTAQSNVRIVSGFTAKSKIMEIK